MEGDTSATASLRSQPAPGPRRSPLSWLAHTLRGLGMGAADAVPGVSGATVALILGIYERFIAAVSRIGPSLVRATFRPAFWRRVAAGFRRPGEEGDDELGLHARQVLFLGFLGLGIALAVVVGARFLPALLNRHPAPMKGFFFGLVLASAAIPYRMMSSRGPTRWASFLVALVGAALLMGLPLSEAGKARGTVIVELDEARSEPLHLPKASVTFLPQHPEEGGGELSRHVAFGPAEDATVPAGQRRAEIPVRARMAGAVGNLGAGRLEAARGLPDGATVRQPEPTRGGEDPQLGFVFGAGVVAISAMVLPGISGSFVLLILGLYHYMTFTVRAALFEASLDRLAVVAVFLLALATGALALARGLRWLFHRYHDVTLAALVGLMLGSLRKIWPFTRSPHAEAGVDNTLPSQLDATVAATMATFVLGVALVAVLERVGRRSLDQS